jgi:hypothetical protein
MIMKLIKIKIKINIDNKQKFFLRRDKDTSSGDYCCGSIEVLNTGAVAALPATNSEANDKK